jgi:hypothetical protein
MAVEHEEGAGEGAAREGEEGAVHHERSYDVPDDTEDEDGMTLGDGFGGLWIDVDGAVTERARHEAKMKGMEWTTYQCVMAIMFEVAGSKCLQEADKIRDRLNPLPLDLSGWVTPQVGLGRPVRQGQ